MLDHDLSFGEGIWSPDGQWAVLRIAALPPALGARDIYGYRQGNADLTPLLVSPEFLEQGPALSPDGRWLAYGSNETGREEVFVRPFPDVESGKVQVSTEGGISPLWAHSGRELFFVDAERRVVAVAVETAPRFTVGLQQPLFRIPSAVVVPPDGSVDFHDVSSDDQRFPMGRAAEDRGSSEPRPTTYLVLNFSEELERMAPPGP